MTTTRVTLPMALSLAKRPKDAPPFLHEPALTAALVPWGFEPKRRSLVAVVKATFALCPDAPASLAEESEPLSGDEPWQEGGSLRRASDFAPRKARVDVTLVGHAYPTVKRGEVAHVGLRLGVLHRELAVIGDRTWQDGVPSRAVPFERMPLIWERAFGGTEFKANPLGRGFGELVLPNLETPDALMCSPHEVPTPACFAPIPTGWAPRTATLGTFDGDWLAERWPYLPADADWSTFNAAPRSLQLDAARGDERYELTGVDPHHPVLAGRLPGMRPRLVALTARDSVTKLEEFAVTLDTIAFDADAGTVALVWRGRLDVTAEGAPEFDRLAAVLRPVDDSAPLDALIGDVTALLLEREGPMALVANDVERGKNAPPPTVATAPLPKIPREEALALLAGAPSLVGLDLSGCDLRQVDLSGQDLRGAKFLEALLEGANLQGADLRGAVLARAWATSASFQGANLESANLAEATLVNADFTSARLDDALLSDANARGARFDLASLARTRLDEALLEGASFERAAAPGVVLSGAWADKASFVGAVLDDAQLYDTHAEATRFDGASLERGRLDGAALAHAVFVEARAKSASFEECDLAQARLDRAILDESVFAHAKLEGAVFDRASAKGARFRGADLTGALARQADLAEASLEGTVLRGADVRGSNLYGAELLDATLADTRLEDARLANTKLSSRR